MITKCAFTMNQPVRAGEPVKDLLPEEFWTVIVQLETIGTTLNHAVSNGTAEGFSLVHRAFSIKKISKPSINWQYDDS